MLNGTTLNNKTIYIKENVILMNSDIKKKILCFLSLKDDTLQEIHFLSNSLGVFEKINTYKCVYASQKDAVHIH